MMSQVSKVFLKNTIRNTDYHNRVVEEEEMWRVHRLAKEKQSSRSKTQFSKRGSSDHHHSKLRSSCVRIPRAHMDRADTDPHSYVGREEVLEDKSTGSGPSSIWMKKLQEVEEKDPDRWGHGGFVEQNPHLFKSESESDTESDRERIQRKLKSLSRKNKEKEKKKKAKKRTREESSKEKKKKHKHKSTKRKKSPSRSMNTEWVEKEVWISEDEVYGQAHSSSKHSKMLHTDSYKHTKTKNDHSSKSKTRKLTSKGSSRSHNDDSGHNDDSDPEVEVYYYTNVDNDNYTKTVEIGSTKVKREISNRTDIPGEKSHGKRKRTFEKLKSNKARRQTSSSDSSSYSSSPNRSSSSDSNSS